MVYGGGEASSHSQLNRLEIPSCRNWSKFCAEAVIKMIRRFPREISQRETDVLCTIPSSWYLIIHSLLGWMPSMNGLSFVAAISTSAAADGKLPSAHFVSASGVLSFAVFSSDQSSEKNFIDASAGCAGVRVSESAVPSVVHPTGGL